MKKLAILVVFLAVSAALLSAVGQFETVGMMKGLPATVQTQVRWGMETSPGWEEFDGSGDVKFLQVEHTASSSASGRGSFLDGSLGERIVEIQVEPNIKASAVEWSLENKGPSAVWVVAAGLEGAGFNRQIAAGASSSFRLDMDGSGYTYVVVDCEGGDVTQLALKAKVAGTDAKTVRGKNMLVMWF
jgi:hypothetical protein